ncbi:MAG: hypothetical protein HY791_24925 [Deltaproteobacteria bacterium]|nr:hypothetical protein [Deltaproteobacteria bacterium]
MLPRRGLALALLFAACQPTIDEYEPRTGLIRGTLVYPAGSARGNAIILLFREDTPPPPEGSGSPINFVVVAKHTLFGDAPPNQPADFVAPFTIPTVAAGTYQIRAFLDADEDFDPLHALLAQPSAGDVAGGFVDLSTGRFESFTVLNDQVVEGAIVVTLGREIPVERPAFAWKSEARLTVPFRNPAQGVLITHPIERSFVRHDPSRSHFLIQLVDANQDGAPDDANGDHLPDVYPRVLLRRVADASQPTVIVPVVTNPLPFLDRLQKSEAVTTDVLELIIPPVAVQLAANGSRTILPSIPEGPYETIVISGTGQTWQVPNDLDSIDPESGPDPTQSELFEFVQGDPLPTGTVSGAIRRRSDLLGDAFVFAFAAESPPPPAGTGRPVAATTIPGASFNEGASTYELRGLADGLYIVSGLSDSDGDFSLLASVYQQPSAGDLIGTVRGPVDVRGNATADLELDTQLPFERPAFVISSSNTLARTLAPQTLELTARGMTSFPVTLGAGDADRDHFTDTLPRILLTLMSDGEARTAENVPGPIIIPALVDPLPFVPSLASGTQLMAVDRLPVIVPPVALDLTTGSLLRPPPAGRYRVNVITTFGQTWSIPNSDDLVFGRVGTALEDPTQAEFVTIEGTAIPSGRIGGAISFASEPPGDYDVVILAFSVSEPPPPIGRGRPKATAIVPKGAFAYELLGLATGTYVVRAFVDTNSDFTPWFDVLNQPDRGDLVGGHVDATGELAPVSLDALGAPVDAPVSISAQAVPTDRPVFSFVGSPTISRSDPATIVRIASMSSDSDVLRAEGVFPIRWLDVDGDGSADDVDGDGRANVTPLVVAEHEYGLASMIGFVDPRQFPGFPALDPTATSSVVLRTGIEVSFAPRARLGDGTVGAAPLGKYRVTVVNGLGQTWSVPNELLRATPDPLATSQSVSLEVVE